MNLYTIEISTQDHQQTMMRQAETHRLAQIAASGKRPMRRFNLLRIRQILHMSLISDEPCVPHIPAVSHQG